VCSWIIRRYKHDTGFIVHIVILLIIFMREVQSWKLRSMNRGQTARWGLFVDTVGTCSSWSLFLWDDGKEKEEDWIVRYPQFTAKGNIGYKLPVFELTPSGLDFPLCSLIRLSNVSKNRSAFVFRVMRSIYYSCIPGNVANNISIDTA